ncbi:trifunctional transcriptional regulator/proline dehydrogenase/pyrroline-5-carboxylate dehydrogenase [Devosia equisanguinis]|uniref:Trifunctional transcriptional regulator/proline dehydrogenase/pyrroline-5-carboxylate dehydrogenase n=1 Tax=Devosia equisanguinis TaxID=2490941 RepID=A0A447IDQ1_9HYPH|nr:CopG family ribbon-helix-helix protein [Devosia equisanguinis]VDS05595.1 trifunctional transcriptional regulator/proline dehydrogenase/pyrroline-5-carboxylate dehydrogenase [Devosia equisanguinis]
MAVSVKLDDDMRERIQALAESKQRSAHWIMREAIRGYVEREEARASFIADADAAMEHYRETGLHVTHAEVAHWLKSWGSDDELEPPQCHT